VSPDSDSDAALVVRMAAGDEHALAVLYDRWATTVHTIAYYLLGQADDAEDAVEETFWQAWREAGRYDASRGAVSTWLSTIARSRALDRQRARRRRAEEPIEGVVESSDGSGGMAGSRAPSASPQQEAEASERARDIAAALEKLPAEQREVIELAYFSGLSQSEIASRTALPLGTVKTRARLALEKLRAPLARHREEAR
jgi:RNA polymerase sigma-70 factor (ECF subfamily)